MTDKQIIELSQINQKRARVLLDKIHIIDTLTEHNIEAHIVGSLAMGLLINHLDIDIHAYSEEVTLKNSFAVMAKIAENKSVIKIECRNMLHTDERCVEWHVWVNDDNDETWQIDLIHIVKGSRYDGYFERMAERIKGNLTDETRTAILRLKYETPNNEHIMGIEYYQAVLRDGIRTMDEFNKWRKQHKPEGIIEWIP